MTKSIRKWNLNDYWTQYTAAITNLVLNNRKVNFENHSQVTGF